MKKGFTLIELLAVIVILAIIAVIAVPIVLNIIDDSKENSNKRSIDMYAKAFETSIANAYLKENSNLSGTYTTEDGKTLTNIETKKTMTVDYKGNKINCEVIKIYEDGSYYLSNCKVGNTLVENYSAGNPIPKNSIAENILKQYGGKEALTEVTDFSANTTGLYKAQDDIGETYYFRGDIKNNYFKATYITQEEYEYEYEVIVEMAELRVTYTDGSSSWDEHWEGWVEEGALEKCEEYRANTDNSEYLAPYAEYEDGEVSVEKTECIYDPATSTETETRLREVEKTNYWRIIRINGDGSIRLIYDGETLVENAIAHKAYIESEFISCGYGIPEHNCAEAIISDHLDYEYKKYLSKGIFCEGNDILNKEIIELDGSTYTNIYYKEPEYTFKCSKKHRLSGFYGSLSANDALMLGTKQKTNYLYAGHDYALSTIARDEWDGSGIFYYTAFSEYDMVNNSNYSRPVINLKADIAFKGNGTIDSPYEIVK